jgi:hypothetical protein
VYEVHDEETFLAAADGIVTPSLQGATDTLAEPSGRSSVTKAAVRRRLPTSSLSDAQLGVVGQRRRHDLRGGDRDDRHDGRRFGRIRGAGCQVPDV